MTEAEKPGEKGRWIMYVFLTLVVLIPVGLVVRLVFDDVREAADREKVSGEIGQIDSAITAYHSEYNTLPDRSSISRLIVVLRGDNPHKIEFLSLNPRDFNSNGEIIDPWGTPLRITSEANSEVHILSAGPDKIFGTADDYTNDYSNQ